MTSRERIYTVLSGFIPDRVPVSLYKINPFDKENFWSKHECFKNLLQKARELQDTFQFYKPPTGFLFSSPDSVNLKKIEEDDKTTSSKITELIVETDLGPLTEIIEISDARAHPWIEKPWIESEKDIRKFLTLPYIPYQPDLSDFYTLEKNLREKGIMVVSLLNPVGVVGSLFAPGDFAQFAFDYPKLIMELLEKIYERALHFYKYISSSISEIIIRIKGAEYVTPPNLPVEYFHNIKKFFNEFVLRFDKPLIEILKKGNFNYICYHWHDGIEELLPLVLKLPIDIIEPICNSVAISDRILKIRKMVGDHITIMGGIIAEDLQFRKRFEIKNMVKECIIQGGKKGRFILIPSDIPEDIPISSEEEENYIEFLESGVAFGKYPID